jgi:integrase
MLFAIGQHLQQRAGQAHVTSLYAKLQRESRGKRKPLSPRTVLHLHRVLHRSFEWAVEEDIIAANLFRRVKRAKANDADTRALSLDEARAFFEAARGSTFAAFFQLAALTGARRGELVGLKWEAVV